MGSGVKSVVGVNVNGRGTRSNIDKSTLEHLKSLYGDLEDQLEGLQ